MSARKATQRSFQTLLANPDLFKPQETQQWLLPDFYEDPPEVILRVVDNMTLSGWARAGALGSSGEAAASPQRRHDGGALRLSGRTSLQRSKTLGGRAGVRRGWQEDL